MSFKYRFTIFTPCYNSEKSIHRVIESLESQTFKDFEWLVINDASTDNTAKILDEYASKAKFPVRVIHNTENKMLYYNFNVAFEAADGELMVFAGHDDRFHSETLETFNNIWKEFGNNSIAGIWCLCQDQNGKQIGKNFPDNITVSSYFEMFVDYIYRQERFGCTRTEVLRKYKFDLESDRNMEAFLWAKIGLEYKTIFLNKILRTYYIEPENLNALTKRKRDNIAASVYLLYLDWVNDYLKLIKGSLFFKFRYHFALAFYSILSNKRLAETLASIKKWNNKMIFLFFYPFAYLLHTAMKTLKKL